MMKNSPEVIIVDGVRYVREAPAKVSYRNAPPGTVLERDIDWNNGKWRIFRTNDGWTNIHGDRMTPEACDSADDWRVL